MVVGESAVGSTHLAKAFSWVVCGHRFLNTPTEDAEALGRYGEYDARLVAEVMRRRGVGDPDRVGDAPDRERADAFLIDDAQGGLDQRVAQVSVVVAVGRHTVWEL
jgi:hypothetical protein